MVDSTSAQQLYDFLARQTPRATEAVVWGAGTLPLHVTTYLCTELPPLPLVTSVRSLVFRDETVLVLRDQDTAYHIVPGGRREPNEALLDTLRREVLEETGWTIGAPHLLGVAHFQHLSPRPPDYPYSHPDFVQLVYMSLAVTYVPAAQLADPYELGCAFRPIVEAQTLPLGPSQYVLLAAALERRAVLDG